MQVRKRDADLRDPALLAANPALTEPIKIPGLQYLDIRVTGKNFEHYLLSQLGWISYLYVGHMHERSLSPPAFTHCAGTCSTTSCGTH